MDTDKFMPLHRKWLFIIVGLVCISLATLGGIMYQEILMDSPWSIIGPILYTTLNVLCIVGILRLMYTKGLPERKLEV
ncbi:MAG: hypothetical protein ACFFBL_02485 [Promethearchaeota archaeon]